MLLTQLFQHWDIDLLGEDPTVAQRPINLVLMTINSYSYTTNDLVLFQFQI